MDPDMSRSMLAAAEKKAMELGIRVAICVVDAGGNIVMFERRNGPQFASTVIAQGKAYTAVARRAPSGNLWPIAQPCAAGYGINTIDSCFVLSVGGVPIIFGDDVSGGIAVKARERPGRHKRSYETKRTINPVQISFSGALDDGRAHYSLGRVKAAGRWRATRAADAEADWQAVLSALVREAEEYGADALVEVNFEVEEVAGGIDGVPLSRLVAAGAAVRFAAAA